MSVHEYRCNREYDKSEADFAKAAELREAEE